MAPSSEKKLDVVEQYLHSLDSNDFETAAAQFTEDTVYVHPPSYQDETTVEGREALLAYFRNRGNQERVHHVDRVVEDGDSIGIVGSVTGEDVIEGGNQFVSYAEFEDGLMSYYIAGRLIQG